MKRKFTLPKNNLKQKTAIIDSSDYFGLLTQHHIGFDGVRTFVELYITTSRGRWRLVPNNENLKAARELIDAQCKEYSERQRIR